MQPEERVTFRGVLGRAERKWLLSRLWLWHTRLEAMGVCILTSPARNAWPSLAHKQF